ncbi:cellulose synthase subunit BcsC [Salmonella enterica subsp. enterica serovar Typhimurium str. ST4581]|nr:cellulose synthase subunit BcsC [Salmonella enterica subsp. enterica serovar Typhimurium str. ST4581]
MQDYLTQFSEGDSVSAARAQLSEQQKQVSRSGVPCALAGHRGG